MSERASWAITTHHWRSDVDPEHLAAVRRRLGQPGAAGGRRHLILEVLAYADEEAESQGRTGHVTVTIHADDYVTVDDDGRGTDTRRDSEGRIVRKPVMATADVRFADDADAPLLPDGLPRRGMSMVAAPSSATSATGRTMSVFLVWHVRHARNLDGSPTKQRAADGEPPR